MAVKKLPSEPIDKRSERIIIRSTLTGPRRVQWRQEGFVFVSDARLGGLYGREVGEGGAYVKHTDKTSRLYSCHGTSCALFV